MFLWFCLLKFKTCRAVVYMFFQYHYEYLSHILIQTQGVLINEIFSRSKLIEQEKFECQLGPEPRSLGVWLSAFTFRPPALLLLTALYLSPKSFYCLIYDLDNFAHVHYMCRMLWDAHVHLHHPLIKEMLMHMHISELSPFTIYICFSFALYVQINEIFSRSKLIEQEKFCFVYSHMIDMNLF